MKGYHIIKQFFDFVLALILFLVLSPFLCIIGMGILISGGFPVIFTTKRLGKGRKVFLMYKFRTLIRGIKRGNNGLSDTIVVNRFSKFIRETHLDELLQLINIIKGDMAFIGPRPLDRDRYFYLLSKDKAWKDTLKIKPGMTCLNQLIRYSNIKIKGIKDLDSILKSDEHGRLDLDLYYIQNESFILDIKIFLLTLNYLIRSLLFKLFARE